MPVRKNIPIAEPTTRNVLSRHANASLYPVQQDTCDNTSGYHGLVEIIENTKTGFAQRLFELRSAKGVSAREMSLALGQGSGYISNLENRHNLPSMSQFFAICEYLGVTPNTFFAYGFPKENDIGELSIIAKTLDPEDLHLVLEIARKIRRKDNFHGRH